MRFRWRAFITWVFALSIVFVHVNWPQDAGPLKSWIASAGAAWIYGYWNHGRLVQFDILALAGDVAVSVVAIVSIAALCARSKRESPGPETHDAGRDATTD